MPRIDIDQTPTKYDGEKITEQRPVLDEDGNKIPAKLPDGSMGIQVERVPVTLRKLLLIALDTQVDAKEIDVERRLLRADLQTRIYKRTGRHLDVTDDEWTELRHVAKMLSQVPSELAPILACLEPIAKAVEDSEAA